MTAYTLLIVESPTLARIINRFNLPGVEVLATGGFSWQPIWDTKSEQLKPKADPAWVSFRNQLKKKAPWASRVVIATDADPAGSFISYSISRFLKSVPTLRTYIHTLSRDGIQQAIDLASEDSHTDEFEILRNRYLIQQSLNRTLRDKLGSNPWSRLVLMYLFEGRIPYTTLVASSSIIKLSKPVELSYNSMLEVRPVTDGSQNLLCKTDRPLNTSALLEKLFANRGSMKQDQEHLNRLFTTIPDEPGSGLISYPRTSAQGYYAETWALSYQYWIKNNETETFLPRALWDILPIQIPHESLRPINPVIDPATVRPLVRKNLYDIYTIIYNHYIKSISAASIESARKVILIQDGASMYENEIVGDLNRNAVFSTMITISDLLNTMNAYGAARPSGFGKLFDTLIDEKWITCSGISIKPGKTYGDTETSGSFPWQSWLEDLVKLMNTSSIEVSKLRSTLDRMIQELPL